MAAIYARYGIPFVAGDVGLVRSFNKALSDARARLTSVPDPVIVTDWLGDFRSPSIFSSTPRPRLRSPLRRSSCARVRQDGAGGLSGRTDSDQGARNPSTLKTLNPFPRTRCGRCVRGGTVGRIAWRWECGIHLWQHNQTRPTPQPINGQATRSPC